MALPLRPPARFLLVFLSVPGYVCVPPTPAAALPALRPLSVSVKIFRLFKCTYVDGRYWLVADMRLQCFTLEYWGYVAYGAVMCVAFVGGLPLGILSVLRRHRSSLFGSGSEVTRRRLGFLYHMYGPQAWWWETEELLRKLLLTAVAVLLDAGSPLQVPFPHAAGIPVPVHHSLLFSLRFE